MSRAARLLDLLQALRRHRRPVSGRVLAGELGISLRSLYRDIATLQAQGAPIEGEAGLGYVLRPGFSLPPLMFGEDELDALILGLRLVMRRGDEDLAAAARDALAKIEAVLPPALAGAAAASPLLAGPTGEVPHLPIIRTAIHRETKLDLLYVDKKERQTRRVVWPIAIGFFEAAEMLAAWCETREASATSGSTASARSRNLRSACRGATACSWRIGALPRMSTSPDGRCRHLARPGANPALRPEDPTCRPISSCSSWTAPPRAPPSTRDSSAASRSRPRRFSRCSASMRG